MRPTTRVLPLLALVCLFVATSVSAAPALDRGLAALQAGEPVPIRNLPRATLLPRPDAEPRLARRAEAARATAAAEPAEFGVLLEFDGPRSALESRGIRVGAQAGRLFTARMRREEIGLLEGVPGLRHARLSSYHQPLLDVSRVDARADLENGRVGTPPVYQGRAGQGVLIGIIDTGIDFTSSDFKDASGRTRIVAIWDQTDAFGPHPASFPYGSEVGRDDIDGSPGAIRQTDDEGHGTLVAGVAAGNGSTTGCGQAAYRFVGVAPLADLVVVKTDFSDASVIDAVAYVFQKATELGKDCVVNLSLGNHDGPHDGSDDLSLAIDALTGPGRVVVGAAGNSALDDIHGKIVTTSTTPGADRVQFRVPNYTPNPGRFNDFFLITGWYDATAHVTIQLRGPGATDTMSVGVGGARALNTSHGKMVLYHQAAALGFGGTSRTYQFEIQVYDSLDTVPPGVGIWEIDVVPDQPADVGVRADVWFYGGQLGDRAPFITVGLDATTLVVAPACADSVIGVGAHCTKLNWTSCADGSCRYLTSQALNSYAYFSSPGPRRDGVLKPEITAPGLGVASTHSSHAGEIGSCEDADDGVHEISLGTSFSSPHVAGAAALVLQAWPGASPSFVRQTLEAHARTDNFTGTVPNEHWGYGKLDIYASLDHDAPVAAVAQPNGGESWPAASVQTVTWSAYGTGIASTDLDYSLSGRAGPWVTLQHGVAATGSLAWTVPGGASNNVVVRARSSDAGGHVGIGYSGRFRIGSATTGGIGFAIGATTPNPSRGTVQVRFTLPAPTTVDLSIVGIDGRRVWRRTLSATSAGNYSVWWNARDGSGRHVPSGIYFLRLESGFGTRTARIVQIH